MSTGSFMNVLRETLPQLFEEEWLCPYAEAEGPVPRDYDLECEYGDVLPWIMVHLNDFHKWPRERVAEWLELVAEQHDLDITFPVPEEQS